MQRPIVFLQWSIAEARAPIVEPLSPESVSLGAKKWPRKSLWHKKIQAQVR
jgi:hypothetical protein